MTTTTITAPNAPTAKQHAFIEKLRAERAVALADRPELAFADPADRRDASALIDALLALPRDPQPAAIVVEPGVYVVGDDIIRVYKTQAGHLAGKVWDGYRFVYMPGAQRRAAQGQPITAEHAGWFGRLHGICCFCAKDLTDDRSIEVGYGPVCAKKHHLPWGDKATV